MDVILFDKKREQVVNIVRTELKVAIKHFFANETVQNNQSKG